MLWRGGYLFSPFLHAMGKGGRGDRGCIALFMAVAHTLSLVPPYDSIGQIHRTNSLSGGGTYAIASATLQDNWLVGWVLGRVRPYVPP